jgi:hypothetical protein
MGMKEIFPGFDPFDKANELQEKKQHEKKTTKKSTTKVGL